jgi:hypothetical protein
VPGERGAGVLAGARQLQRPGARLVGPHGRGENLGVVGGQSLAAQRRLSFLPEPTVQALRSASILGSSFALTDLATITGGSATGVRGRLVASASTIPGSTARPREVNLTALPFPHGPLFTPP